MKKVDLKEFFRMCFETSKRVEEAQVKPQEKSGCGGSCNCSGKTNEPNNLMAKKVNRRQALGILAGGAVVSGSAATSATSLTQSSEKKELSKLEWKEYFKGNYRLMTEEERKGTLQRLERIAKLRRQENIQMSDAAPKEDVLYGYAFNISKCQGYQDCIKACIKENNLDRKDNTQYIRIFEMENGNMNLEDGKADYFHEVPKDGHYYLGTQCFQCENPPCVTVCPVGATWKEPDGIVVIDYDWCIGCRYCQAACPYWARRFNWHEPEVPKEEVNPNQHYLGNRLRKKGVMEKCTFCIQRTRKGRLPACAEACPTGARIFGNILDPNSEIRYVLENKKVFRLKEDLGTEPKFWYFMD